MGQILGWAGAHPLDPPMGAHVSLPVVDSPLVVGYVFVKTPTPCVDIKTHMCGFTRKAFVVIWLNFVWHIII